MARSKEISRKRKRATFTTAKTVEQWSIGRGTETKTLRIMSLVYKKKDKPFYLCYLFYC